MLLFSSEGAGARTSHPLLRCDVISRSPTRGVSTNDPGTTVESNEQPEDKVQQKERGSREQRAGKDSGRAVTRRPDDEIRHAAQVAKAHRVHLLTRVPVPASPTMLAVSATV